MFSTLQARDSLTASTARVWMKSAIVEREAGNKVAQRQLLEEGLKRFPSKHLMSFSYCCWAARC